MSLNFENGVELKMSLASTILVAVAAVVITCILAATFRPVAPVVQVMVPKEPTIDITQTLFVPVPKIIIKTVYLPTPPDTEVVPVEPKPEKDPVFEHREPVVPDSLRVPMNLVAKN